MNNVDVLKELRKVGFRYYIISIVDELNKQEKEHHAKIYQAAFEHCCICMDIDFVFFMNLIYDIFSHVLDELKKEFDFDLYEMGSKFDTHSEKHFSLVDSYINQFKDDGIWGILNIE